MKNIRKLKIDDLEILNRFISDEKDNFYNFQKLGWSKKNIYGHFKKKNNLSIGYFCDEKLYGFLIGEKLLNYINFHLEIHLMFVSKKKRRKNIGSSILKYIETNKKLININKMFLEVSENNLQAVNFYEKNNFVFFKFRHNYYKSKNEKVNAKCYFKNI